MNSGTGKSRRRSEKMKGTRSMENKKRGVGRTGAHKRIRVERNGTQSKEDGKRTRKNIPLSPCFVSSTVHTINPFHFEDRVGRVKRRRM